MSFVKAIHTPSAITEFCQKIAHHVEVMTHQQSGARLTAAMTYGEQAELCLSWCAKEPGGADAALHFADTLEGFCPHGMLELRPAEAQSLVISGPRTALTNAMGKLFKQNGLEPVRSPSFVDLAYQDRSGLNQVLARAGKVAVNGRML